MATRRTGQQVQRSTASSSRGEDENTDIEPNDGYESDDTGEKKETRLTLMEEVLLLGLKDREVELTPDKINSKNDNLSFVYNHQIIFC